MQPHVPAHALHQIRRIDDVGVHPRGPEGRQPDRSQPRHFASDNDQSRLDKCIEKRGAFQRRDIIGQQDALLHPRHLLAFADEKSQHHAHGWISHHRTDEMAHPKPLKIVQRNSPDRDIPHRAPCACRFGHARARCNIIFQAMSRDQFSYKS